MAVQDASSTPRADQAAAGAPRRIQRLGARRRYGARRRRRCGLLRQRGAVPRASAGRCCVVVAAAPRLHGPAALGYRRGEGRLLGARAGPGDARRRDQCPGGTAGRGPHRRLRHHRRSARQRRLDRRVRGSAPRCGGRLDGCARGLHAADERSHAHARRVLARRRSAGQRGHSRTGGRRRSARGWAAARTARLSVGVRRRYCDGGRGGRRRPGRV